MVSRVVAEGLKKLKAAATKESLFTPKLYKMFSIKQFLEVVLSLSPEEKARIRRRLKRNCKSKQRLALFDLIDSKQVKTDLEAAYYLYKSKPNSTYSHLKSRLRHNIQNFIIGCEESDSPESLFLMKFKCWRNILITQFFISREAYLVAGKYLEQAEKTAEKYVLISELIVLDDLKNYLLFILHKTESTNLANPIGLNSRAERLRRGLELKQTYLDFFQYDLYHNLDANNLPEFLMEAVFSSKPGDLNSCPRMHYWALQIKILYERICTNYSKSLNAAGNLWSLTMRNPELFSRPERLETLLVYSRTLVFNSKEELAAKLCQSIIMEVKEGSMIELWTLELIFLIHFYKREFDLAEGILRNGLQHSKISLSDFYLTLWKFYEAHLEFVRGRYEISRQLLNQCTELNRHKSKWLIGKKLLEIYNLIALGQYDLVEFRVNALRQLLKRQSSLQVSRAKYICKALTLLIKNDFDLVRTLSLLKKKNRNPGRGMKMVAWIPLNFEVLKIEEFLEGIGQGFNSGNLAC